MSKTPVGNDQSHDKLSRKKIAFLSVNEDPAREVGVEEAGGQGVYLLEVGQHLSTLGWQVDMFTRKASPDEPVIIQHRPNCRTIRLIVGPEGFAARDKLFHHMPEFLQAFLAFEQKENISYSLIHSHYWLSGWAGLERQKYDQITLVHTFHSIGEVKYRSVPDRPLIGDTRLKVEQRILEEANCILATSPQEKEDLRRLVSQKGNITVIPCPVNISNFQIIPKDKARAKINLDLKQKVVLYVGRFDKRKGLETLVRAVAKLILTTSYDLKLVIVGGNRADGADLLERERIERLAEELGLKEIAYFVGRLNHDVLPFYYAAADICVIPSHYEPFGLVAIEAMACATPVVASGVGGLNYSVVSEETGLLVKPKDIDAFADAINRILSNPSWANKLGKNARHRVLQHFSLEKVTGRLNEFYLSLINRKNEDKPQNPPNTFIDQ